MDEQLILGVSTPVFCNMLRHGTWPIEFRLRVIYLLNRYKNTKGYSVKNLIKGEFAKWIKQVVTP